MNYTASARDFSKLVKAQLVAVNGKVPLYFGIGACAPELSPFETTQQALIARDLGASGFILFQYDRKLSLLHMPAMRRGMLAEHDGREP